MGSIIKGTCKSCGYETNDLFYGGGFRNFKTCCKFPALDKAEKEVKMANIMDRTEEIKQNPNLVFYDDKSLSDKKIQNEKYFHEWGEHKVYRDGYLCPKCNQFSLGFEGRGCWD